MVLPYSRIELITRSFLLVTLALGGAVALPGCMAEVASDGADDPEEADAVDIDDGAYASTEQASTACHTTTGALPGRWNLSAADGAIAKLQIVKVTGATDAAACSEGKRGSKNALDLVAAIRAQFPNGFGSQRECDTIGNANEHCRPIKDSPTPSLHSDGRAVDLFLPPDESSIDPTTGKRYQADGKSAGTTANNARGDVIASWLVTHAKSLKVQRVIWDRSSWTASGQSATKLYGGTVPHNNHLHVEVAL